MEVGLSRWMEAVSRSLLLKAFEIKLSTNRLIVHNKDMITNTEERSTQSATLNSDQPRNPGRQVELLAPAGHWDALHAAIENGADAVYFGLDAHNARARATNFAREELPEIMQVLHKQGVLGYLTLNTLIFPSEIDDACSLVELAARSGVDALIVQDVGLAKLARDIAPGLAVHASTQMTVTSASGVRAAKALGCDRVILARELSIKEIEKIHTEEPGMPLETFIHGALCVAYSGQCLTSEALGGRSANRGECAQACRMPYELLKDGVSQDLGNVDYLLSPQDLAAYEVIPELIEAGVISFKIEGRLKSAEYVANVTSHYRKAIDAYFKGVDPNWTRTDRRRLELAFSRGLGHGFFDGNNHKLLVRGDFSNKRGPHAGFVEEVRERSIVVRLHADLKAGDGVMIDVEDNNQGSSRAVGGRVYAIRPCEEDRRASSTYGPDRSGLQHKMTDAQNPSFSGRVQVWFMRDSVDFTKVHPGQSLWQTNDQVLDQELRESFSRGPHRKQPLFMRVKAISGTALEIEATTRLGMKSRVVSTELLKVAERRPADQAWAKEHLGTLGDTTFELETDGKTLLPASLLNGLRRELIEKLVPEAQMLGEVRETSLMPISVLHNGMAKERKLEAKAKTELTCLVRDMAQLRTMSTLGLTTVYADFQDVAEYKEACVLATAEGIELWLATPRIEKPGEYNLFKFLEKCKPAGILARNAGGVEYCTSSGLNWLADFSLNITNAASVEHFHKLGAKRMTAGFDLNVGQLFGLLDSVPPQWIEVVVHQRVAMFHMEHCVFCMAISPGTDKSNCGRPCDIHKVELEDRVGARHRLMADVGCRNTLFNATAQSAAEWIPKFLEKGVAAMRLEFVDESPETVRDVVMNYQSAMSGQLDPRALWKRVKATNQYGLTRGTLQIVS